MGIDRMIANFESLSTSHLDLLCEMTSFFFYNLLRPYSGDRVYINNSYIMKTIID